jgi:predicted small metal-binding protein
MKRFSCGDVVPGCKTVFRGQTEADILTQVAGHARADHGLQQVPDALVEQVRAHIHEDVAA